VDNNSRLDPLDADTDDDGLADGTEDANLWRNQKWPLFLSLTVHYKIFLIVQIFGFFMPRRKLTNKMPTNNGLNFFRILSTTLGLLAFVCLAFSIGLAGEPPIPVDGGAKTPIAAQGTVKGEVLVRFIKGAVPPRSREMRSGRRIVAGKMFAALSRRRHQIYQHVTSEAFSTAELLEIYRSDPQVESVSPNYARSPHRLPDDPFFDQLWGLRNIGQSVLGVEGITGADIDAALAWNISTGDNEVVVAVIDSGVDYNHEDLSPNMWQNPDEVPGNDRQQRFRPH